MNILILGTGIVEQRLINLCLKSKHLHRIYTASSSALDEIPNVEFLNYQDLIQKAKALKIDIVLVVDKKYIQDGIVDIFRKNFLNVISVNQKWFNLESSRLVSKQLLNYYDINNPTVLKAPITFPVVIKTDKPHLLKIAYSMQELVNIKEEFNQEKIFLEDYLKGDVYHLLTLWDGQTALYFNPLVQFTEVQIDRLDFLKTKINFMLADETPDFIGFFTTKIIWAKNDWYVLDFIMRIDEKSDLNLIKSDFLYVLNSAIYQKLNEIRNI